MSIGIHGEGMWDLVWYLRMRHEYWHTVSTWTTEYGYNRLASNCRRRLASGYRIREMLMGHVPVLVLFPSLVGIVTIITIFHGAYVYFYIIYYVYTHADTCNIWWYHVISCDIMWYHVISGFPTMDQQPLWMLHRNGRTIGRRARCLTQGWWCAKLSGVILIIDKLSGH